MLNARQIRFLKAEAHRRRLQPVVTVGHSGVTEAVLRELDTALTHHELLKVRGAGSDRPGRQEAIETLTRSTGAELIHLIGHVTVLFRRNPDRERIRLP